jgi:hypothetical protein
MKILLSGFAVAAFLLASDMGSQAANKACDPNACYQSCVKAGGQARKCPAYCSDKIARNPKCK